MFLANDTKENPFVSLTAAELEQCLMRGHRAARSIHDLILDLRGGAVGRTTPFPMLVCIGTPNFLLLRSVHPSIPFLATPKLEPP